MAKFEPGQIVLWKKKGLFCKIVGKIEEWNPLCTWLSDKLGLTNYLIKTIKEKRNIIVEEKELLKLNNNKIV